MIIAPIAQIYRLNLPTDNAVRVTVALLNYFGVPLRSAPHLPRGKASPEKLSTPG